MFSKGFETSIKVNKFADIPTVLGYLTNVRLGLLAIDKTTIVEQTIIEPAVAKQLVVDRKSVDQNIIAPKKEYMCNV
jgi:hypothetical protein